MKRFLVLVLLILCYSSLLSYAEENNYIEWQTRYYVDDFGDVTDNSYLIGSVMGKFSNSATTDSILRATILIDDIDIAIMLYEYDQYQVKNPFSTARDYSVSIKDRDGIVHDYTGTMYSGGDRIYINGTRDTDSDFLKNLQLGGKIGFSIREADNRTTHYVFSYYDYPKSIMYQPAIEYYNDGDFEKAWARLELLNYTKYREENTYPKLEYIYQKLTEQFSNDPESEELYQQALKYEAEYDYKEAVNIYEKILLYKDSQRRADSCNLRLFEEIGTIVNNRAMVTHNGKCGFIDSSGNLVIPCEYDSVSSFESGVAAFKKSDENNTRCGIIDIDGNIIAVFDEGIEAGNFSEGLMLIQKDNKYGFADTTGKIVIPIEYTAVGYYSDGLVSVEQDGKWGAVDRDGNMIISPQYTDVFTFRDGLAFVRTSKDDKFYFINTNNERAFKGQFDLCHSFYEGLAICADGTTANGRNYLVIDKAGNTVLSFGDKYSRVYDFQEGLALVIKNKSIGFINTNGEEVIPCQYKGATFYMNGFNEGLISVSIGTHKCGVIDKDNNIIVPFEYDAVSAMNEGVCVASRRGYINIIDDTGKIVY